MVDDLLDAFKTANAATESNVPYEDFSHTVSELGSAIDTFYRDVSRGNIQLDLSTENMINELFLDYENAKDLWSTKFSGQARRSGLKERLIKRYPGIGQEDRIYVDKGISFIFSTAQNKFQKLNELLKTPWEVEESLRAR